MAALYVLSLPVYATYISESYVCGDNYVQLLTTTKEDTSFEGMIINDAYFVEQAEVRHSVDNGEVAILLLASDGKSKMAGIKMFHNKETVYYMDYDLIKSQSGEKQTCIKS
ncbi:hypothetical protein [Citrobacter portucalensis]|uniref:Uncharacterized protein n=1 Tax=Citrobacter portucalensis TaxID=1639133 RepID=A0A9X4GH38_9ENTR|nr:hypothetical protein [Citrobacter portucalensis]MDE9616914.1 hypothetical protein [Citrobacter portucalensis]